MSPAASLRCRRPSLDPPSGTAVDSLKGGQSVGQNPSRPVWSKGDTRGRLSHREYREYRDHRSHRNDGGRREHQNDQNDQNDRDHRSHREHQNGRGHRSYSAPAWPLNEGASRHRPGNPDMTEDAQAWEAQKARWQSEAAAHPGGQPFTLAGLRLKEVQDQANAQRLREAQEADRRAEEADRRADARRRAEAQRLAEAQQLRKAREADRLAEAQQRDREDRRRIEEERRGRVPAPWPVRVANGQRGSFMPPPGTRGPAYDARIRQAQVKALERQVDRQNEYNAGMGFYR
jgi:hypothetical protein